MLSPKWILYPSCRKPGIMASLSSPLLLLTDKWCKQSSGAFQKQWSPSSTNAQIEHGTTHLWERFEPLLLLKHCMLWTDSSKYPHRRPSFKHAPSNHAQSTNTSVKPLKRGFVSGRKNISYRAYRWSAGKINKSNQDDQESSSEILKPFCFIIILLSIFFVFFFSFLF